MNVEQNRKEAAFMREARIGLTVVALLLITFVFVAIRRYRNWDVPRPIALEPLQSAPDTEQRPPRASQSNIPEVTARTDSGFSGAPVSATDRSPAAPPVDTRWPRSTVDSEQRPSGFSGGSFDPPPTSPTASNNAPGQVKTAEGTPKLLNINELRSASAEPDGLRTSLAREGGASPQTGLDLPAPTTPPIRDEFVNRGSADEIGRLPREPPASDYAEFARSQGQGAGGQQILPVQKQIRADLDEADRAVTGRNARPTVFEEIVIEDGEGYWSIAQRVYGDGRFFSALYQYNRPYHPEFDLLPAGARLRIPKREVLRQRWPHLCPLPDATLPAEQVTTQGSPIYVTEPGESLFDVARKRLGQASRYVELIELNRDVLPEKIDHITPLRVNTPLRLPR